MKTNQDFKNAGLAALNGNWKQAIVATFILLVLSELLSAGAWGFSLLDGGQNDWSGPVMLGAFVLAVFLYLFFLTLPVVVGFANAFNRLYCESDSRILANVKKLSFCDVARSSAAMLLMSLVTSFFSAFLIVPGVIASMSLFLVPYLVKDYPKLSVVGVLRLSRKMMQGHKMQLFKLQLSFLGWIFLNLLTLGIGSLWLMPYMMTTMAAFYQDVKAEYIKKEGLQGSAL